MGSGGQKKPRPQLRLWMFALINKNDHAFLYWNGLLLLFVTFAPFPTALLAEYLLHPEARVAANLYTGTFLAISLTCGALWRHASLKLRSTYAIGAVGSYRSVRNIGNGHVCALADTWEYA
jgi:hypothetical protein